MFKVHCDHQITNTTVMTTMSLHEYTE